MEGDFVSASEAAAEEDRRQIVASMDEDKPEKAQSSAAILLTAPFGGAPLDAPPTPHRWTSLHRGPGLRVSRTETLSRSTSALPTHLRRSGSSGEAAPNYGVASSPPSQFDELVRRNYMVKQFMFSTASTDVVLPPGFSMQDTQREMFGVTQCRRLLEEYVRAAPANQPMASLIYTHMHLRPHQLLYFFAPRGYGLRTLTVNYAREQRINLLLVSTPLFAQRYVPGTYAAILSYARQMEPCLVLLHHLGNHWSKERFDDTGHELFAFWQHAELNTCIPPARLWVVIHGVEPFPACHSNFQNLVTDQMKSEVEALEPNECATILWRAYADCMRAVGIIDDRPAPPGQFHNARMIRALEERLGQSNFQRELRARQPYLEDLAARVHEAASRARGFVLPSALHRLMGLAFKQSCHRVAARYSARQNNNNNVSSATSDDPNAHLPSDQDFEEAARHTFPAFTIAVPPPPSSS